MKIATIEFNEIVKGMYISEDKKGLVVEILDLTGLDKNVELGALSVEVTLKIEECVQGYADKIECIVFDNRKYWELDLGDGFVLDLEALCSIFHNLKTVACGGGEFTTTDYPNELRLMSGWDFCDLARTAYRNGDLEKAEYYYQWAEITDFYDCMHTFGVWLSEKGKHEEAEELYKKIAGEKDKYGAVNNSYALLLNELGRQEEAQKYFNYVLHRRSHEDAQEFADCFLYDQLQDEDSPYWRNLCLEELNNRIRDYAEACGENGKTPNIERILLNARKSSSASSVDVAKTKLMQIYGTGRYAFEHGDVIDVLGFPNLDKFKKLASVTYKYNIMRALYFDFVETWEGERVGELNDDKVKIFEEALLTIDVGRQMLFWLYYNGKYVEGEVGSVEVPQLIDQHKAANLLVEDDIWPSLYEQSSYLDEYLEDEENYGFFEYEYNKKRLELLEEAYKLCPESVCIVTELLMNLLECNITRFIEVLQNAPHKCLEKFFNWRDDSLFEMCEDIKNAEELEKYLLLILERCSELGLESHCVQAEEILFWLYYVGRVPLYTRQELIFPQLVNIRKAAELMGRQELWEHGMIDEGFYIHDEEGKNLRVLLEEAYKLYPENEYIVVELLGNLINNNIDIDIGRFVEVLRAASYGCLATFVVSYIEFLYEMCEILEDEAVEKYILAIIECCSDIESEYWDINEWKLLMLSLYQTGYHAEWYSQPIESPSLKNVEKAKAFAEKYDLELFNFDDE